jgi:SAM-dependent methyltransferase
MSPLANSYLKPSQLSNMEPFYPLHVYVCVTCLLVQLEEFARPDHIFSDYAYFSSYSMLRHAKNYVEMAVSRFNLNRKSLVVEIASNDGYLLQHFVGKGIPVLGIEPAANVAEEAVRKGIKTIIRFFGEETAHQLVREGIRADVIVANNVLAHVPKLNDFVRGMRVLLAPNGVVTAEFPHLMRLMEENQFDTIYHEHFSYFSLTTVKRIFATHGLVLFDVDEVPTHGGSLRIYARHVEDTSKTVSRRVLDLTRREAEAGYDRVERYLTFAGKAKEIKRKVLSFLITAKGAGKSIVGYGAAAKGNTFLNYCGIRDDFIDYVVDRSPHKQGLYLPGTHIPILPPDKVKETKPDYLFLLAWNLKDEITREMACIRDWKAQFVVAIPDLMIYP